MKQSLRYVFLAFGVLVALDYFVIATESFFQGLHLFPTGTASAQEQLYNYDYLPSVNFNFFTPNGIGKSYVTQGYGYTQFASEHTDIYPDGWHDGIDLAAPYGAPVYSPDAGTVLATGNQDNYCYRRAFGAYAAVRDTTGQYVLWYGHLGDIDVRPGEEIAKGIQIGTIGDTGFETGPHLIFSLFNGSTFAIKPEYGCGPEPTGQDEDPIPYLQNLGK